MIIRLNPQKKLSRFERSNHVCRTAIVPLEEGDKRFFREIPNRHAEYNASAPGDFYELLGVDKEAKSDVIKSAFRDKQRIVHPDVAGMIIPTWQLVAVYLIRQGVSRACGASE